MCGICGIYNFKSREPVDADVLRSMADAMVHRGPDDEGFFVDRHLGLGMRRLSVIDLVSGHQPISNEDGRIRVVSNGEIYNYRQLRQDLENKGHRFSTNTDTETIIHAYEEHGEDCVQKLNGMFAFALWDGRNQKLVLARDRLGIKPLYYFFDGQRLVFGSELKAVLADREVPREIDLEALDGFLTFEYIPAPLSIFKGIKKLHPAHLLVLQDGKVSLRRYWDLCFKRVEGREEDLAEALYALLQDSVRLRLVSDVPLGAFLSGGIDSSTIVWLMSEMVDRPVKTFSIGFDDPSYNELEHARTVARYLGTEHHELTIHPNTVNLVEGLIRYLDEPFADVSIFPTYLVSQLARQHVTVTLSGDGGDELFAGYEWYIANKIERYCRIFPLALRTRFIPWVVNAIPPSTRKKGFVNKLKRFVEGSVLPESLEHFRWSVFLTERKKAHLYSEEFTNSLESVDAASRWIAHLNAVEAADSLWQQQFADIKTYLADDILVKVDRMSMANSLEARTPYLDYRVVEFAAGLPDRLKLNGFQTKYLLKRSMASRLPGPILSRKKEGFSIPMKNWLKQDLRPLMQDVLSPARIKKGGFFNTAYVERLKAEHLGGVANHSHQLWSLVVFEIWHDLYVR